MLNYEFDFLEIIKSSIEYRLNNLNWKNEQVGFWLDGIIYGLSNGFSNQFFNELCSLRNQYLGIEEWRGVYLYGIYGKIWKSKEVFTR